jgi:hypothetical protein
VSGVDYAGAPQRNVVHVRLDDGRVTRTNLGAPSSTGVSYLGNDRAHVYFTETAAAGSRLVRYKVWRARATAASIEPADTTRGSAGQCGWQPRKTRAKLCPMQPLRAKVHNGRLVLDEPTDLPEGEVVYLHPVEAEVGEDDGFDDDERAALTSALDEGIAAAKNGDHVDADELVQDLLAQR